MGGATVVVSGHTPSEGGSILPDTAREEAPGRYVAPAFPFGTAGEWSLEVRAHLPDGRVAAAKHPIRVIGPPGGR